MCSGDVRSIHHEKCQVLMNFSLKICLLLVCFGAQPARSGNIIEDFEFQPPAEFELARNFAGYQHIETLSTIVIAELAVSPAVAYEQIVGQKAALAGWELNSHQTLSLGAHDAVWLEYTAKSHQMAFQHWILIVGDRFRSVQVDASLPSASSAELSDAIRKSLRAARWNRAEMDNMFRDLPFTVSPVVPFRFIKKASNSVVLAPVERVSEMTPQTPRVIASYVRLSPTQTEAKVLAEEFIRAIDPARQTRIIRSEPVSIDRLAGIEMWAMIDNEDQAAALSVRQIVVVNAGKCFLLQAVGPAAEIDDYAATLNTLIQGVRFKFSG